MLTLFVLLVCKISTQVNAGDAGTFAGSVSAKLRLQNIESKSQHWFPADNCPWRQGDEYKADKKCNRGDENLKDFRSELKRDYYRTLKGLEIVHEMRIEPFVVNSNYSNSLFCVIDKCGSTAWKRVIQKAMGATPQQVHNRNIHQYDGARIGDMQLQEAELLYSPKVVRWMIVRNPYARVFSSYYEKIVNGGGQIGGEVEKYQRMFRLYKQDQKNYHPTFEEFIKKLYSFYNATSWDVHTTRKSQSLSAFNGADRHFDLQTSRCGMPQGFGWDYVLKSELIQEWYPQIINILNFTEVVMSGWPAKNQCFLNTPGMECEGPSLGGVKNGIDAKAKLHTLRSKDHMLQAYNEQIAAMVTEMYMPDIIGLNYPIWNGNPDTFLEV